MPKQELNLQAIDWQKLPWQETPYSGVFIFTLLEEPNPENPRVPLSTVMAVRVDPGCSIPLHCHKREPSWTETLTFPATSNFELYRIDGSEIILITIPSILIIESMRAFGLRNNDAHPLFFTSEMKPGFTGYGEIEMIK